MNYGKPGSTMDVWVEDNQSCSLSCKSTKFSNRSEQGRKQFLQGSYSTRNLKPVWRKQTVWESFEEAADRWPTQPFLETSDGLRFTYEEVRHIANRTASALASNGIGQGNCVAVRCTNTVEFIIISLALYAVGAVKVALSNAMGSYELAFKLKEINADVLIEDSSIHIELDESSEYKGSTLVINWNNACENKNFEQWVFSIEHPRVSTNVKLPHRSISGEALYASDLPDKVTDIFFTSGSSGNPKAVGLSHDMMLRSAWANAVNRNFYPGYRLCIPLPFSHVYAYIDGFLSLMQVGGTVLLLTDKPKAKQLISYLASSGACDVLLVPNLAIAMIEYLVDNPIDLPCLDAVYCSASSCPDWLWSEMKDKFGVSRITTGYGMTEVCGASFQTLVNDTEEILVQSVGKLIDSGSAGLTCWQGHTIMYKTIDPETGIDLPEGEPGELCCRGLTVFRGYINNPKANKNAFDDCGWFHTGDLGFIDQQGYLHLIGRTSETYKINGENVSPRFVEKIAGGCGLIRRIRIVGVPEARYGEVGAAFVELEKDTSLARQEVRDYCASELARYQIPKYFFFVNGDFWPCNETGKVVRTELKKKAIELISQHE